jgi:hypothetical protein
VDDSFKPILLDGIIAREMHGNLVIRGYHKAFVVAIPAPLTLVLSAVTARKHCVRAIVFVKFQVVVIALHVKPRELDDSNFASRTHIAPLTICVTVVTVQLGVRTTNAQGSKVNSNTCAGTWIDILSRSIDYPMSHDTIKKCQGRNAASSTCWWVGGHIGIRGDFILASLTADSGPNFVFA